MTEPDSFELTDRINALTDQVNANTRAVVSMQDALAEALQNPLVAWLIRKRFLPWIITRERYFPHVDYAPVIPRQVYVETPDDEIVPGTSDDLVPPGSRPYRRRKP